MPTVVVVGLGPGGAEYVTQHTLESDRAHPASLPAHRAAPVGARWCPTRSRSTTSTSTPTRSTTCTPRSPSASSPRRPSTARCCTRCPARRWCSSARCARSCADRRVECAVHPAMSFLDVAYARLGIDPVEAGVTLVDGHEFATAAAGNPAARCSWPTPTPTGCSATSSSPSSPPTGDEPVVILQRLGTPDELVTHTTWAELDRTVEADHLTCIYIPHLGAPVGAELVRFHQLARTLREQCPWDQEQTHHSLVRYLLEETYEVVDALEALDPDDPATDEALDRGARRPALPDRVPRDHRRAGGPVHDGRRRAGRARQARAPPPARVRRRRGRRPPTRSSPTGTRSSATRRAHVGVRRRAHRRSRRCPTRRRAAQGGQGRLRLARRRRCAAEDRRGGRRAARGGRRRATQRHVHDELGDLLFAVVNVARHLGVEPEAALRAATQKFRRRFEQVEALARERGIDLHARRPRRARRAVGRGQDSGVSGGRERRVRPSAGTWATGADTGGAGGSVFGAGAGR